MSAPVSVRRTGLPGSGSTLKYGQDRGTFGHNHNNSPLSGCQSFEAACPAIAQAPGVAVTVATDYAAAVKALHLKACQDGTCKEADVQLVPGMRRWTRAAPRCRAAGDGPGSVCSATSSPDGTQRGMLSWTR